MDKHIDKIIKNTKYEAYRVFENENYVNLVAGIQIAECMKSEVSYIVDTPAVADELPMLDLTVSDSLSCSYCRTTFESQSEQRSHYKLDWHRHNLKQSLRGAHFHTQEEFSKLADDVSSISGSESDSSEDLSDQLASNLAIQRTVIRHPKVFFVNRDNKIVSLYRCILHGKEDVPSCSLQLCQLAENAPSRPSWAIIMLGGGHFAAAIFKGNNAVLHKTFHSYTVRARQGGSQASRDSRSNTSHPKSAGASLRRYNEAAFQQHIQELLEAWSPDLASCQLIFLRAVSHNRGLVFSGKSPPIKKNDPRLRNIPFPTRRATFSEVKRVHGMLSSLEVYGPADEFMSAFPTTPRRIDQSKEGGEDAKEKSSSPSSSPDKSRKKLERGRDKEQEGSPRSPTKPDRGKARQSPSRPLPPGVELLAVSFSAESEGELAEVLEVVDFSGLQEFDDDVPQKQKQRHERRKKKKSNKAVVEKSKPEQKEPAELLGEVAAAWRTRVLSARNDSALLAEVLEGREGAGVTEMEGREVLAFSVDLKGNRLLHQASSNGQAEQVRLLLEAGADPALKNTDKKTAFRVAKDWPTKKAFRRFQAQFPDKYDYDAAEVPGPLTEEIERAEEAQHAERKAAQRKARKDKLSEKKKLQAEERRLEEQKRQEREERSRFLALSDREKRALAAERRVLASGGSLVVRCFLCATDMTGQVPFTYESFSFCTMTCLKAHRFQPNKPK